MMVTNATRFGTEKALEPLRRVNAAGTHLLSLINALGRKHDHVAVQVNLAPS